MACHGIHGATDYFGKYPDDFGAYVDLPATQVMYLCCLVLRHFTGCCIVICHHNSRGAYIVMAYIVTACISQLKGRTFDLVLVDGRARIECARSLVRNGLL